MHVFSSYPYICLKFLHQQRVNALDKIGVEEWNAQQELKIKEIKSEEAITSSIPTI